MATGFVSRKIRRGAGQALTIFLLLIFMAGSTNLELLHSFGHDHNVAVTHSAEQEKDACHRLIYHHIAEPDSEHDSHLFASVKCKMCDLTCHKDQTFQSILTYETAEISSEYFAIYKLSLDSYWAVLTSSRAPPYLS